ncbi:MAG: amidohydrolase family protein [Bacteroidia bacterium]
MNLKHKILFILLSVLGLEKGYTQHPEQTIAFTEVNVIPMDKDHVLKNQTVLIRGSKIMLVGNTADIKLPSDARIISAKGMYLIPGLADMHAHLPAGDAGDIGMVDYLKLNLIRGITTLRSMRGDTKQLALRDSLRKNLIAGPDLFLASPVLPPDKDLNPDLARTLIKKYKQEDFDFIKYLYTLNPALYDSVMTIASKEHIRVAGHCPKAGLEAALLNGQASVEHLDGFLELYKKDSAKFRETVHKMGLAGICACPDIQWYYLSWNQLGLEQLDGRKGMNLLSPELVGHWDSAYRASYTEHMKNKPEFIKIRNGHRKDLEMSARMLATMQEQGLSLLLSPGDGPYVVPGFSMLEECRNFIASGISPYETLRAGTVNASAFFKAEKEWGTIEQGKKADLVLLRSNPLDNLDSLDQINGVMTRGVWYSAEELEKIQTELKERYNRKK